MTTIAPMIIPTDVLPACRAVLTDIFNAEPKAYDIPSDMSIHDPKFEAITYLLDNDIIRKTRGGLATYRVNEHHSIAVANLNSPSIGRFAMLDHFNVWAAAQENGR